MADFYGDETVVEKEELETAPVPTVSKLESRVVIYCPKCSLPPEYCEFGPSFDECLPWIRENCPEVLSEHLMAKLMAAASINDNEGEEDEDGKKKKSKRSGAGPGAGGKKKQVETKVVIARVQRQKRKFVTVVTGLETVPELKIKDAAKLFGKKFATGASVGDTATGGKEIVIQGDVYFELPTLLINEFKICGQVIYYQEEGGSIRPYA